MNREEATFYSNVLFIMTLLHRDESDLWSLATPRAPSTSSARLSTSREGEDTDMGPHTWTTMHYSVLQCTTAYYNALQCITVYYSVLQCTTVYYSVLYCNPLHAVFALHCRVLCFTELYFTALPRTVPVLVNDKGYTVKYTSWP